MQAFSQSKNSLNSPFSKTPHRTEGSGFKIMMKNMMEPIDEVQRQEYNRDYSISDRLAVSSNKKVGQTSQSKFLNHFYTINDTASKNKKFVETVNSEVQSLRSNQNKYLSKMQQYQSIHQTNSILDDILHNTDSITKSPIRIDEASLRFINKPTLVSMDSKAKHKVISTINLFNRTIQNNNFEDIVNQQEIDLLYLKNYAHVLANLPNSHQTKKQTQLYRGKSSSIDALAKQQSKQVEVNTDPQKDPVSTHSSQPLRKIDILLIQIMREKKRRGLVQDYFKIMEMKLIELLDYILADEHQYQDLQLSEKMKLVLKNLEKFKGKTFEGQLKINLLRIFFQQFRNLKMEKMNTQQGLSPKLLNKQAQQSELAKFMLEKQNTPNFANIKLSEAPKKSDKFQKSFKNKEQNDKNDKNLLGFSFNPKKPAAYETMSVDGASFKNNNNKTKPQGPITYKHSKSNRGDDQWIGELV